MPLLLITILMWVGTVECLGHDNMQAIPQKIWQTYKTKDLPAPARAAQLSWLRKNPRYKYALFDDQDIEEYIREKWDADTLAFYLALPLGVMKADLWRYLILATEGGIYSDIDSLCCQSIKRWVENVPEKADNILLLGLENNAHFCQWTIVATKAHPAMQYVCRFLVETWKIRGIDLRNPHFVHKTTGPAIWTAALLSYIGETDSTPGDVYQRYLTDNLFRQNLHNLGIFLFAKDFYNGFASRNLYGSQNFDDGYVHWIDEAAKLSD